MLFIAAVPAFTPPAPPRLLEGLCDVVLVLPEPTIDLPTLLRVDGLSAIGWLLTVLMLMVVVDLPEETFLAAGAAALAHDALLLLLPAAKVVLSLPMPTVNRSRLGRLPPSAAR